MFFGPQKAFGGLSRPYTAPLTFRMPLGVRAALGAVQLGWQGDMDGSGGPLQDICPLGPLPQYARGVTISL